MHTMAKSISLTLLPQAYGVARLDASDPIPPWADGPGFVSISRAAGELSIACLEERIPHGLTTARGWRCLRLNGPFAFDETGVVASVVGPLATQCIGVFVVSSHDGDHLLLQSKDLAVALDTLRAQGHTVGD